MEQRTSGMLFSYASRSQYHDSCGPKTVPRTLEASDTAKPQKINDFSSRDPISQQAVWKQTLQAERRCLKNWEHNWSFLADYDAKGNIKEKEELPESPTLFSDALPNTNSGNYGSRQTADTGRKVLSLESQFFSQNKRRKLPSDLLCY